MVWHTKGEKEAVPFPPGPFFSHSDAVKSTNLCNGLLPSFRLYARSSCIHYVGRYVATRTPLLIVHENRRGEENIILSRGIHTQSGIENTLLLSGDPQTKGVRKEKASLYYKVPRFVRTSREENRAHAQSCSTVKLFPFSRSRKENAYSERACMPRGPSRHFRLSLGKEMVSLTFPGHTAAQLMGSCLQKGRYNKSSEVDRIVWS